GNAVPIPDFDENGFLPPGVHACTLDEIQQRFGRARVNFQRSELFARLQEYVREARSSQLVKAIALDGSFVTDKASPNDIDMIVILAEEYDNKAVLRPFQYNVVSKQQVRRQRGFDIRP